MKETKDTTMFCNKFVVKLSNVMFFYCNVNGINFGQDKVIVKVEIKH